MMNGARWFIVIVLLLTVGLVVVPYVMRQNQANHTPGLTVLVDGKRAGQRITIKVDDTVYQCKKGICALPSYRNTHGNKFTIAKLTDQRELLWVIDATDVLKKFDRSDMTITVDTANSTVIQVDSLQADTNTTTEQPLTLANLGVNLNVDENTVKIIGVIMVVATIVIGLKFMSAGGAHH
ncbi:MAG: hypothetical protein HY565_04570 [Candidatus Kerfeldbacteria bacterium]|nr:hypothetical protein [Candidatus Kerfeldbacteria bacterium]